MKYFLKPILIFVCLNLGSVCSDDQNLKELCSQKSFDRITVDRTPVKTTKKEFILYRSLVTNTSETHLWKVMAEKDSEKSSDKTIALKPVSIKYELNRSPLPTKPFVDRSVRENDELSNFRIVAKNLGYLEFTLYFYFDNKGWGVAEETNQTQNRIQYVYLLTFDRFAGFFDGITGLNKTWTKKTVSDFLGIDCSQSFDVKTESTVVTTVYTQLRDTSTEATTQTTTEVTTETTTEDLDVDDPEIITTPESGTDWFVLSLILLSVGIPVLMIILIIVIWFVVSKNAENPKT